MAERNRLSMDDRMMIDRNASETFAGEGGAVVACASMLDRLQTVLEEENAQLAGGTAAHHAIHAERKHQLLRELMSLQKVVEGSALKGILASRGTDLRHTLLRNRQLLTMHIDAVKEVSDIIVDAIHQSESDGTYSRHKT